MVEMTPDDAPSATVKELHPGETARAFDAMSELRPHLTSVDEFVARVDDIQRAEGYRLIGALVPGVEQAAAVAGFRVGNNLALGRNMYVDDLVTSPAYRSRGHAGALMEWLIEEAVTLGCAAFHLDSNTNRHDAHRLYLKAGMNITSFHFGLNVLSRSADR
jgi:GNAT superfamily N-acetyltransferase